LKRLSVVPASRGGRSYVAEPNTLLLGNTAVEILQRAGLAPDRAGWTAAAAMHYVLGHTIEEQPRSSWSR
jgi:hypothetical protein